jgi:diguanylate cyclase (GGDEF)-like protein
MRMPRPRTVLPALRSVGGKFVAAITVVVLGLAAVAAIATAGLNALQRDIDMLVGADIAAVRGVNDLVTALFEAERAALEVAGQRSNGRLDVTLDQVLLPRVRQQLRTVDALTAGDPGAADRLGEIRTDLDTYVALRRIELAEPRDQVARLFQRMTASAQELRSSESARVRASGAAAMSTFQTTRVRLLAATVVFALVTIVIVGLLLRDLLRRIRRYGRYARAVAAGRPVEPLAVTGVDELSDLGLTLVHMVDRTQLARQREADQAEFADTLQVTATEDEAHELLQRHLERSMPGAAVVVLKRNNSENRLDAATTVAPDSPLAGRLSGIEPRTCLALRFGRGHEENPVRPPLLRCALCVDGELRSTCEPLLVGGQVIGSVVVTYVDPLQPVDEARIRNTVAQAAPVLANLRNLALAEFRANNDSLTGLPNKRATEDTLKRMVAQANRSITPLAAAMLDLDHFKQVNDRFGHAKGDEVLAAVGAAVRSCLRESDFAGRYGGEELLLLCPDTTAEGAVILAERIREAIAAIRVPGVDRQISVSIGVADLIQHGGDAPGLLRQADRALYTAKAVGRNRVIVAGEVVSEDASSGPAAG